MRKGDLVMLKSSLNAQEYNDVFRLASIEVWQNPGVIVRGIYEGQSRLVDPVSGKIYATELTPAVDVMLSGRIVKEVPIRCLDKVEVQNEKDES
jgi:hypothetical protein